MDWESVSRLRSSKIGKKIYIRNVRVNFFRRCKEFKALHFAALKNVEQCIMDLKKGTGLYA
jgi:hypothetical protein